MLKHLVTVILATALAGCGANTAPTSTSATAKDSANRSAPASAGGETPTEVPAAEGSMATDDIDQESEEAEKTTETSTGSADGVYVDDM